MADLAFRIEMPRPATSELQVHLRLAPPRDESSKEATGGTLTLFMPTWTPGSYLIREYSRHVVGVRARDAENAEPLPCVKVAKNRWSVELGKATKKVDVEYVVYCHELSVRTADVTPDHAFWNNACVLLWPIGRRRDSCDITVCIPQSWTLTTALPTVREANAEQGTREVTVHATNMDRAFDSPCLAGRPHTIDWVSMGVGHRMVLDGLNGLEVPETLVQDLDGIVQAAAGVFGGKLPYDQYTFLCLLSHDGHGGLEHSDSTTLLHPRTQLKGRRGYLEFLSLAAHELFHAWNVKRLRPREFVDIDYESETYTSLLWLIEGWTAYYDDLICLRAGVCTVVDYLAAMSKNVQAMLNNPGRHRTSLAESSFDAWIRLYRPDENTRNSSQNYYGNGAVAALCLDLQLRQQSGGERSLDDVIRGLYDSSPTGRGYSLEDVLALVEQIGGSAVRAFLTQATSGPLDPPLQAILQGHGVTLTFKDADQPQLGVQFEPSGTVVASVARNSAAWVAGLMPGDEVLALEGLRVDAARWTEVLGAVAEVNLELELLIARRGVIKTVRAIPMKSPGTASLDCAAILDDRTLHLRNRWLQTMARRVS